MAGLIKSRAVIPVLGLGLAIQPVSAACEQAGEMLMEINIDDLDATAIQATIMRINISPDGHQLKDIF